MTDKQIPFSGPMVRALLEGRKTQTRRVAKLPSNPENYLGMNGAGDHVFPSEGGWGGQWRAPYATDDRLWVREAWRTSTVYDDLSPREMGGEEPIQYEADSSLETWGWPVRHWCEGRYRPSMFMPRWASRLTLTVTDVRVQRVQEISGDDAIAEGIAHADGRQLLNCYGPDCPTDQSRSCNAHGCWGCREDFRDLWNRLNAKRGYGWDANPWVAAYTFTVHHQNIDQIGATTCAEAGAAAAAAKSGSPRESGRGS